MKMSLHWIVECHNISTTNSIHRVFIDGNIHVILFVHLVLESSFVLDGLEQFTICIKRCKCRFWTVLIIMLISMNRTDSLIMMDEIWTKFLRHRLIEWRYRFCDCYDWNSCDFVELWKPIFLNLIRSSRIQSNPIQLIWLIIYNLSFAICDLWNDINMFLTLKIQLILSQLIFIEMFLSNLRVNSDERWDIELNSVWSRIAKRVSPKEFS
jgi:hypothetical protein